MPLNPSVPRGLADWSNVQFRRALAVPLAGGEAALYFRLFALSADGSSLTLYRSPAHVLRSNKPRPVSRR